MSWTTVRLGDLCRFISGGTPSRQVSRYFDGHIPWITGADISADVIKEAREYITEEAIEESATNIIPKGNILLVTRTGVGKVAIAGVDICISQDFTGIIPNRRRVDVRYLFRLIQARKKYFELHQRGATIQGVTREVVTNLEVPLAPVPEQKRIVAILDKADELRTKRCRALTRLDDLLQSVFLEMFGDPVTNPKGWESLSLDEVLIRPPQNGAYFPKDKYTDEPDGVEMVHMSDAFYDIVQRGNLKRVKVSDADIEKYGLASNDILIARRSLNYEGAAKPCRIPPSNEPLIFESSLIRISPDYKTVTTDYLYYYLANEVVRRAYVFPHVTKSTISGINQAGLKRIKVIVPPVDKQVQFDRFVNRLLTEKERLIANLTQLDNLFHSLQQRAFRGELTSPTSASQ